jgi:hypothetical protein
MEGREIDGIIDELENTLQKPEFLNRLDTFNRTFVQKFKSAKEDNQGSFPFGTAMPGGPLTLNPPGPGYSVVHTIYYVPYFPPRAKEVYPYPTEEHYDLEYWKGKRLELSRSFEKF